MTFRQISLLPSANNQLNVQEHTIWRPRRGMITYSPTSCSVVVQTHTHHSTCPESPGRSCCAERPPAQPAPPLVSACRSPPGHTTSCFHSVDAPLSPCRRKRTMRREGGIRGEGNKWRTDEIGHRVAESWPGPSIRQHLGQMCSTDMRHYFRCRLHLIL